MLPKNWASTDSELGLHPENLTVPKITNGPTATTTSACSDLHHEGAHWARPKTAACPTTMEGMNSGSMHRGSLRDDVVGNNNKFCFPLRFLFENHVFGRTVKNI
jgi:hypothetical protein